LAKVLLTGKYSAIEPLGLMYLAGALKEDNHEVNIHLLEDDYKIDFSKLVYYGKPDYVGFAAYTGFHKEIFEKANIVNNGSKTIAKTIIGGPHATFFADDCILHAHYVVKGEGIQAIKDICNGNANPGIVFNPKLVHPDDIPMPCRDTLYEDYRFRDNRIKSVMTSFGCPGNCCYCYNDSYRKLYGDNFKVRQRSVDLVIEECLGLKKYPLDLIFFQDDCFGISPDWLSDFAAKYRDKVGVPFHCQLRPEVINDDRIELLKTAGCHGVTMAIESASEKVRRRYLNRKMSNDQILDACRKIKEAGFRLRTEQMLGLPGTTIDDELELLRMNIRIQPDIAWVSMFTPYLGTTLGDWCKDRGLYNGTNDDLTGTFFSDSKLNFYPGRIAMTNMLLRIFSTCAKMPHGDKLAQSCLRNGVSDMDGWFHAVKDHLYDSLLYNTRGIL